MESWVVYQQQMCRRDGDVQVWLQGHFYRGKRPFYRGKLAWFVWPDFHEINLPWEISIPKGEKVMKFFILLQHETAKKWFFNGILSHCWEKDRCWYGRFHVKMRENFELWFVGLDLGTIFPKNLFLACNRTVRCSWTAKWNVSWSFKKCHVS